MPMLLLLLFFLADFAQPQQGEHARSGHRQSCQGERLQGVPRVGKTITTVVDLVLSISPYQFRVANIVLSKRVVNLALSISCCQSRLVNLALSIWPCQFGVANLMLSISRLSNRVVSLVLSISRCHQMLWYMQPGTSLMVSITKVTMSDRCLVGAFNTSCQH